MGDKNIEERIQGEMRFREVNTFGSFCIALRWLDRSWPSNFFENAL